MSKPLKMLFFETYSEAVTQLRNKLAVKEQLLRKPENAKPLALLDALVDVDLATAKIEIVQKNYHALSGKRFEEL